MGQGAHKGVEHREEPAPLFQAGAADRVANVLLVVPLFGVFPGDVKPVGGAAVTGPGDGRSIGLERGKLPEVPGELWIGQLEKIDQQRWA